MNVAFIPVRGGSKSIPLKNIKLICGKPLVYWTVRAACDCHYIDKVFVATDSKEIKEAVLSFREDKKNFLKIEVIGRSSESASDTATTEFAMLEFAESYEFDNIVLIQATSPLLTSEDINRGFKAFAEKNVDSVLSVVRQKRFHWANDEDGFAFPTNYDVFNRPRRQDYNGYFVENGAFYISSKADLLKYKNRLSGKIKMVEMNEDSFFEIDEPSDWIIIETLMRKNSLYNKESIPKIKMFLTDCDGCLTDGGMYYSEYGDELKKFNTRDGVGFELLKNKGIYIGIITSEKVKLNQRRAEKLNLDIYEAGCKDKMAAIIKICKKYRINLDEVAYVGDDINDLEVIKKVGYSCCPADAIPQIQKVAKYIAKARGGEGVIREVADRILKEYGE